ncbi:MAG: T9SS type A sorting domain-containing protein, partial [Flavicella sp.]|nr:T9SS type A sorting domain-containing protein [Flavicella sp.]
IEIVNELEKDLTLILYTISGTKVLKLDKIINHHSVDISYLNKGVYILAGKNDGKTFSKKLLIR